MVKTLRQEHRSKAAYTLVDLSDLDDELRKDIILDATEGGGIYGIRVVEESVNGGARAPIYGVYNDGPDAERWTEAKAKLGITGDEVDDSSVYAGAGIEVTDPRKEAALREAAAQEAEAEATRLRSAESDEVRAITGDGDDEAAARRGQRTPDLNHPANIVDPSAVDAENEATHAENQELATPVKNRNKAPK